MNRECDQCFYSGIMCKPDNNGCEEETDGPCCYCYGMYTSSIAEREKEFQEWATFYELWMTYIRQFADPDW